MADSPSLPSPEHADAGAATLFVSYSRKDLEFVRRLSAALVARDQEVWVDLEDIQPSDDWLKAIQAAIERADAFIFVVSPDSIDAASVCAREIEHALSHNKRIVPIVCRTVDTRVVQVADAIARLNWIRCIDEADFDPAIDKLIAATQNDLEWTKQHTRLLERAVEWNAARHDDSFLLQKNDLVAAERWLALGPGKEPKPTELQTRYIFESRASAAKRQRFRLAAVSVALVITVVLAVLAWFQRNEARSQANIALARQLAAQAQVTTTERPALLQRGILLAAESLQRYPTLEANQFLRSAVPLLPRAVGSAMQHRGAVQAVIFSPDGKHLATASSDGTAGVWDVGTGRRLLTLQSGTQQINAVAFSPNGALLATAGLGIAQVWDANGQRVGSPLTFQPTATNAVAFTADGNFVATMGEGGADVWALDAQSAEPAKAFSTGTADVGSSFACLPLSAFALSPDGTHAAVSCRGQLRIWETATWRLTATIPYKIRGGLRPPLHPIAFSADGHSLLSADELYDVDTGSLRLELHLPAAVSAVAFSRDGGTIALASGDSIRVVKSSDGIQLAQLNHTRTVRALDFSPDGSLLATASDDNTARIWRLDTALEIGRISHDAAVLSVAFSPDGRDVATGSEDGRAGLWEVVGDPFTADRLYGGTDGRVVAMSANGRFLAVEHMDRVTVHAVPEGREVGHAPLHDDAVPNLEVAQASVSPNGRYLWMAVRARGRRKAGSVQKTVNVWDTRQGVAVASFEYDKVPESVVFTADERLLATDDQFNLSLWDLTKRRKGSSITHGQAPAAPVFSADGAHLAVVEWKPGAVRVFETTRLQEIRHVRISDPTFRVVAFSPDGTQIAVGSNEAVRILPVTGDAPGTSLPVKYASALLFSPGGRELITANWNFYDAVDRSVRIWDVSQRREIDRLPLLDIERRAYADSTDTQLAFSEDGRFLASENQGTLRLWDMRTRRETSRWVTGLASQLRFTPDGSYLISNDNASAAAWRWDAESVVAKACARLTRNLDQEEWRMFIGDAPYRKTCPRLP